MTELWKRKLLAYLHDPPSKPFNVAEHREVAESLILNAGLDPQDAAFFFSKVCDHTAAAADRVICPRARAMKADWKAEAAAFKHPLGGGELRFESTMSDRLAEDLVGKAQPHALIGPGFQIASFRVKASDPARTGPASSATGASGRSDVPRVTRGWSTCLPTRESQTTPFGRIAASSALCRRASKTDGEADGLKVRTFDPAFLLVQIGPVQEFISQARTTRDCWSGSYLLSWLIAHGIKAVTDRIGPDCVLYPALRGQPPFDFLYKSKSYEPLGLWEEKAADGKPRKLHADEQILTPNLPTRWRLHRIIAARWARSAR